MQYYSRHCASEGFKFSIDLTTSVTQEHWRCSINGRRDFLLIFYCNYTCILHYFLDSAKNLELFS